MRTLVSLLFLLLVTTALPADLADDLAKLAPRAIDPDSEAGKNVAKMLSVSARARLQAAALRENAAWAQVTTRGQWETFRDERLRKLKEALGVWPDPPAKVRSVTTGRHNVGPVVVENLVIESRPGLVITANLYRPADVPEKGLPGILLSHSHHSPRMQGELQDMGLTWATAGCYVLVPDHLGHGERRQHRFNSDKDYDKAYKVGRQDYYFRHNSGAELHLVGESLMGWLAWDLMRCVDVLHAQPGIDKKRIVLLGAVAGGGDPAGVTAALDPRIAAVVPFNFGGTQPDYTTPPEAERDFYWFGLPYWEGTRCLRRGAADGFAHWVITGSVAPRGLIHAHEFAWDAQRDPAWPRLEKVFGFYKAGDKLATAQGQGTLQGKAPESSHCNNIGALHRSRIYPTLAKWFDMPIPKEVSARLKSDELRALTPEAVKELGAKPLHEVAHAVATTRLREAQNRREASPRQQWLELLCNDLTRVLGDSTPTPQKAPKLTATAHPQASTFVVEPEPGILVPAVLLKPALGKVDIQVPVVVGVAQQGKAVFLKERAKEIATLLEKGTAVCLVDVRGTGETAAAASGRRHTSRATDAAHMEGLLGRTLLGARLRDLRTALAALGQVDGIDPTRIALWGESFAPVNAPDFKAAVPLEADPFPHFAEPLGQMLALLALAYDPTIVAVHTRGGLDEYRSLLKSPYLYVPYDVIPPGLLSVTDIPALAKATGRPVLQRALVDGLNRRVAAGEGPPVEQWLLQRLAGK